MTSSRLNLIGHFSQHTTSPPSPRLLILESSTDKEENYDHVLVDLLDQVSRDKGVGVSRNWTSENVRCNLNIMTSRSALLKHLDFRWHAAIGCFLFTFDCVLYFFFACNHVTPIENFW